MHIEIYCTVHAEPQAVVRWYKDSMLLDSGKNRIMESSKHRHKLRISRVGVADLGNYSCMAENSLGRERSYLNIKGEPLQPVVLSSGRSRKSTEYTLKWETVSLLVIQEYRILFRQIFPSQMVREQADWTNIIPTV